MKPNKPSSMTHLITIATLMMIACVSIPAFGQTEIKGRITDKKGNPIPGATISLKRGNEKATSDLDGTFSISSGVKKNKIRVEYSGFNSVTEKTKPEMRIKMKKTNYWNMELGEKGNWFAGVDIAFNNRELLFPAYGFTFGYCKKAGFYISFCSDFHSIEANQYDSQNFISYNIPMLTGRSFLGTSLAYSAGLLVRLGCPIHLMLGAGVCIVNDYYETIGGRWINKSDADTFPEIGTEIGLMFKFRHFYVKGSYSEPNIARFGAGFCF